MICAYYDKKVFIKKLTEKTGLYVKIDRRKEIGRGTIEKLCDKEKDVYKRQPYVCNQ